MRIAAIYIEEHEYLFDNPQTINFGTKYFYSFTKDNDDIIVHRTLNNKYIHDFFDLTKLESKLTNINAIVGQNGAGKSTLLDVIRSQFIEYKQALPQTHSLFLFELDNNDEPIVTSNDLKKIYLIKSETEKTELIRSPLKKKIQTIYYSPHYDYKYNPNFENVDNHDISFDKILEQDLSEQLDKDTNDSGSYYSTSQELLFKNSLRQITFLSSGLIKKYNIFKDLFQLQEHYEPLLVFRGYNTKEEERNTPFALRNILKSISAKLESELKEWPQIRVLNKNKRPQNQVEINQYILKRKIIQCIISLLYRQMERRNSFLYEGYFPDDLKIKLDKLDAYQSFLLFAEHSAIKSQDKSIKIFSDGVLKNLLLKLYDVIEKTTSEELVQNTQLKPSKEDAIEILRLQRQFLIELNVYYYKYSNKNDLIIKDGDKIEEFINYMPFERRMSSGENSLLNFYSRVYDFLNSNLKEIKSREPKEHYILLLDEADLTFHLAWKKKFVKALLKTLPYFFNELANKPSIEIVFTTHDPITLSDLPNTNVIYIERQDYDSLPKILEYENKNRPRKTFGANISDLIADSFFIENSFIGDFVYDKIHDTIEWLNNKKDSKNAEYHEKLINLIDEPIVQRKLAEMYDDKMKSNFQKSIIEEQIKKLIELKEKL